MSNLKAVSKCDKGDYLNERSSIIDDLSKENRALKDANIILSGRIQNFQVVIKADELGKTNPKMTYLDKLECNFCRLPFLSKTQLNDHLNLHCGTCSDVFTNIAKLKRHQ